MTPHISDLIAFRRAENSGHIQCDYTDQTTYCPPTLDCRDCVFIEQCDDGKYCTDNDSDHVTGWFHAFQKMPEFNLSFEELQNIYPEYFI